MLNYDQREAFEEVEYAGMDVSATIDRLTRSPSMDSIRGNLTLLISEAKILVEKAEELYKLVGVTEDKE
jgi:hypothetical protein